MWLGRVTISVRVTAGLKSMEREALVDTGSETLGLPADVAKALGINSGDDGYRNVITSMGPSKAAWVRAVRIEIMGRSMVTDAIVTPEGTPVLIGCKQLEVLNLSVHPKNGVSIS